MLIWRGARRFACFTGKWTQSISCRENFLSGRTLHVESVAVWIDYLLNVDKVPRQVIEMTSTANHGRNCNRPSAWVWPCTVPPICGFCRWRRLFLRRGTVLSERSWSMSTTAATPHVNQDLIGFVAICHLEGLDFLVL
jgi:hypothetical protein